MQQFTIGSHQVELEEDIFFVRWRGNTEHETLVQLYGRLAQFIADRGYALALFDLHQAEIPNSALRRWAGEWWRKQEPDTVVMASYGMNASVRTVMVLINRALALFQGPGSAPGALFSSESEARAWLAVQRVRLKATKTSPGPSARQGR